MVEQLRGMFAFALWDAPRRRLLLARDPLGIKPLYYADDGWTLRFASQAKALLAGGAVSRDPDPAGIVGFHLLGSVPEPFTVWREIRSLPAGCTLLVEKAGPGAPVPYFSIAEALSRRAAHSTSDLAHARAQVADAVRDSVRHHLVADVPVAVFLSAGLDSGALLGTMADLGRRDVTAVTLAFKEFRGDLQDEAPLAAEVAARYGAHHVVRTVDRREIRARSARHSRCHGSADYRRHQYVVCRQGRARGWRQGRFERSWSRRMLRRLSVFVDVPRSVRFFRPFDFVPGLGRLARHALGSVIASDLGLHPKVAGLAQYGGSWEGAYLLRRSVYMPWELPNLLDRDVLEIGLRRLAPLQRVARELRGGRWLDGFDRVSVLETALYMRNQLLRDADWAGMAHSIEIRVPMSITSFWPPCRQEFCWRTSTPRSPWPTSPAFHCPRPAATEARRALSHRSAAGSGSRRGQRAMSRCPPLPVPGHCVSGVPVGSGLRRRRPCSVLPLWHWPETMSFGPK